MEKDDGYEVILRMTFPRHLLKTKCLEYRYCVMFPKADYGDEEYFYRSTKRSSRDIRNWRRLYWDETYGGTDFINLVISTQHSQCYPMLLTQKR